MTDAARESAPTRRTRTPALDREIAELYVAGATLAELQQAYGFHVDTLRTILGTFGVKLRPRGKRRPELTARPLPPAMTPARQRRAALEQRLLAAYDAEEPIATIASRLGTSVETVRRVARRYGRPHRAPEVQRRNMATALAAAAERRATGRRAARGDAIIPERREDQLRHMVALYDGERWTLEEIGALYGVSRERIRQLIARERERGTAAVLADHGKRGTDPIRVVKALRDPVTGRSLHGVAVAAGATDSTTKETLAALGLLDAAERLWRWRRAHRRRTAHERRKAELIAVMQAFARKHGRAPRSRDFQRRVDGLPFPMILVNVFGSYPAGLRAAGFTPRLKGFSGWTEEHRAAHIERYRGDHMRRGHERVTGWRRWKRACGICLAENEVKADAARDPTLATKHRYFNHLHPMSQRQVLLYDLGQLLGQLSRTMEVPHA